MPNISILISLLSSLLAVASANGSPLSWEEVRKLAEEKNPGLESAQKSKQASDSAYKEALYGGYLPKITLNADRTRSTNDLVTAITTTTKRTDLHYSATASLNLFRGFSTSASVARAAAAQGYSESSQHLISANLRHDLRVAYFNIFVNQERLRLNEKDLKRVEQNARLVALKYNSGSEARWNVRTTKAELDKANYNISNGKTQLEAARENLASLLQLDTLPERPVSAPDKAAFSAAADHATAAIDSHPELVKSRFSAEEAMLDIRLARSAYYPSLDLSLSRSYTDSRPDGTTTSKSTSNAFAITAEWNIFNGAADYFKVQEANLNREAADLNTAGIERKLVSGLRTKGAAYRAALDFLPVSQAAREAAEERERTVSEQYRSGLKTYIDWEQAESQLLTSEQEEIRSLSDTLIAFADLELALGLTLEQP